LANYEVPNIELLLRSKFIEEVERVVEIVKGLAHQSNVFYPTDEEIQEKAQEIGRRTEFGNFVFFTSVRSRSAGSTVYIGSPKVMQPRLRCPRKLRG